MPPRLSDTPMPVCGGWPCGHIWVSLRVLAANQTGRALLRQMRETARLPVITKPAEARHLAGEAKRIFELEARATDLYTLAYPVPDAAGTEWRESPVMI